MEQSFYTCTAKMAGVVHHFMGKEMLIFSNHIVSIAGPRSSRQWNYIDILKV